jgi:tripartite-type tricarboxylate transporter receptor subunit TctC
MPETRFIVRNVPGAGHIVGANTIFAARPDGLTIGTFVTGLIYAQLLEQEGIRFDLAEMSWVGRMSEEGRSLVLSNDSGIESAEELLEVQRPIVISTSGVGASNHIETRMLAYALGLDVTLIPNMQNPEAQMSMLRGEVDGVLGSESSFDDFVAQGSGRFVMAIAGERSAIAGVPQAREFIIRDDARPLFALIETMAILGRVQAGPPEIPPARLAVLRDAFNQATRDPELLAEAQRLKLPIAPGTGEEVAETVLMLLDQTPETIALLRRTAIE